ncbi:site-specific integrase [Ferruginibacter sp.]
MKIRILFWIYKSKKNSKDEAPLYLRLTINGKKAEIATGYYIKCADWDKSRKLVKSKSHSSTSINNYISVTTAKILQIQNELTVSGSNDITVNSFKELLLGKSSTKKTLLEAFEYHNNKVKLQVGKGKAAGTFKHYEVSKKKLINFIKHSYNTNDVLLDNLSHKFLVDFTSFLMDEDGLSSNSAMKKLTHLKTVVSLAIANGWTNKNPFGAFKCTYKNPKREVLTKEELEALSNKDFGIDRLNYVRDVFVFCCYTGLRYSDVEKLTPNDIIIGIDGEKWLSIDTKKTGERCRIPLLAQAQILIDKYKDNPVCLYKGVVFPVKSNQKMNAFLKEIATVLGINKNLHFHLSRHTFATTIMLNNGYSLESVGKMLGQKSIRTTQIYGKMTDVRLSNEMQQHRSKIEVSKFNMVPILESAV